MSAMDPDPRRSFEADPALDPLVDSASREGLEGSAPADAYAATRDPDEITIAPDGLPSEAQPRWRQDFPVDWPRDQFVARRDFARFLVLTSGAFVAGQGWIAAKHLMRARRDAPAPRQRIASVGELPVGTVKTFRYPNDHDPCVLIVPEPGVFLAYSQACTHLSCPVIPKIAENVIECPCHEGLFDLRTGKNIAGPPPRPLPQIALEVAGDEVFAVGVRERTV